MRTDPAAPDTDMERSARFGHVSVQQLYVLLSLARTKVAFGAAQAMRSRAMDEVELLRAELRRRGEGP